MVKFKTPEEMIILIDKINMREIYWDNMEDELARMRGERTEMLQRARDRDRDRDRDRI